VTFLLQYLAFPASDFVEAEFPSEVAISIRRATMLSSVIFTFSIAISVLGLTATALPLEVQAYRQNAKAIYFMTNEELNSIVAIPVGFNGTLSGAITTCTGGNGGSTIDSTTGKPNAPDALASQSSLTIAGKVGSLPELSLLLTQVS
jgi:hypothetical protein